MTTTNEKKNVLNKIKGKSLAPAAIAAAVALLVGIVIGGASNEGSKKTAEPVAAVTTTVTAAPKPAVTQVVEKTSVPQACLDALDEGDKGFNLASDMANEFSAAITAIQESDISGMQDATSNIKSINSSLERLSPQYNSDKTSCRGSAE